MVCHPLRDYNEMFVLRLQRGIPHHIYMKMKDPIRKRALHILYERHGLYMAKVEVTSSHNPPSIIVIVTGLEDALRPKAVDALVRSVLFYDQHGISMIDAGPRLLTLLSYDTDDAEAAVRELRRDVRLPSRVRYSLRPWYLQTICWTSSGAPVTNPDGVQDEGVHPDTAPLSEVSDLERIDAGYPWMVKCKRGEESALVSAIHATGQQVTLCTHWTGGQCIAFGQHYPHTGNMYKAVERAIRYVTDSRNMERYPVHGCSTKRFALQVFRSVVERLRDECPLALECRLLVDYKFEVVLFRESSYDKAADTLRKFLPIEELVDLVRAYAAEASVYSRWT